jgi:RNA polymerase sigma-70 factor (ECF subfamily)
MTDTIGGEMRFGLTEGEAIERARQGDATAFEYLYKAHSRRVYNLCLRISKNPVEAEDLAQQAFLQVFRKIGTFRGEACFSTWLHRVVVNVVLMRLRRRKPTELFAPSSDSTDTNGSDQPSPCPADASMLAAIEGLNLWRAVGQLPAKSRHLFLLHEVMGYRHSEIASLVGCSIGCSKSQLHRVRKHLRRLLSGEANKRELAASA